MADSESVYLPPLEQCLTGEALLLSWDDVYEALSRDAAQVSIQPWSSAAQLKEEKPHIEWNEGLLSFLDDELALRSLKQPFDPFSPPSQESRSAYDTRTSAINVTDHGDTGPYDLKKIKEDALWLSNETKIDESSALRIVILEWQSRAGSRLLQADIQPEKATTDQPGFGTNLRASFLGQSVHSKSPLFDQDVKDESFDTDAGRRSRLLVIFLQERLNILRSAEMLVRLHIAQNANESRSRELGVYGVANKLVNVIFKRTLRGTAAESFLIEFVKALEQRIKRMECGSGFSSAEGQHVSVEATWAQAQVDETIVLLQMWYQVLGHAYASAASTTSFFKVMRTTMLLDIQVPLVSIYSLDVLKISASLLASKYFDRVPDHIDPRGKLHPAPFWTNIDAMQEINSTMVELAAGSNPLASIPIYAWVLFVHSRSGQIATQSPGEGITYDDSTNLSALAHAAVENIHLFDIISTVASTLPKLFGGVSEAALQDNIRKFLLGMLSYSLDHNLIQYEPEVVGSLLSLLDGERSYWTSGQCRTLGSEHAEILLSDYLARWLYYAKSRFPLEAAPLVRLMKAFLMIGNHAPSIYETFCEIFVHDDTGFTDQLNLDFTAFDEADFDPSKGYFIELQQDLPLFISTFQAAHSHGAANNGALVLASQSAWQPSGAIPAGTVGEVLGDQTRPLIVDWDYSYSPLDYVIDWLGTATPGSQHVRFSTLAQPSPDDCSDIISLSTAILQNLDGNTRSDEHVAALLDTKPRSFEDAKDLISIVFEIFEYQLQQHRDQLSSDASTDLLTRCVEFIHTITFHRPARIWPLLARSQLLDLNGSDPSLVAIVSNSEMVKGDYAFLHSCVKLFERMVDLSIAHEAVVSLAPKTSTMTRFASEAQASRSRYIPGKTLKVIMIGYMRIMVSVFENSQVWQFASASQRISINVSLMQAFDKILRSTYGFFQPTDLSKKDSNVLAECALQLTDLCLTGGSTNGLVPPMISILCSPFSDYRSSIGSAAEEMCLEKSMVMKLCSTVLRVAIYTHHGESALEERLFKAAPQLARLYASSSSLQAPTAYLMDVLLTAALRHDGPPPSLLGHMGASTAKSFLSLLTRFGKANKTDEQQVSTWKLLTTVVSSQQQWFALYLLTGKAPRELTSSGHPHSAGCAGQAVFKYALDQSSKIFNAVPSANNKNLRVALAILDFIAQSYNHWPWAVSTLRQHPKFIQTLTVYFSRLAPFENESGDFTWHTAIGATIAEILTMHLHTARQLGDVKPALSLVNKLSFVKNYAFKPPSYKWSAHKMLRLNISELYSNLDISRFQHTLAFPTEYGSNFFYDTPAALSMIQAVRSSEGRQNSSDSFRRDIRSTNIDLSQIDARMQFHHKAKLLVVELAHALPKDTNLDLMDPLIDILGDVLRYMDLKTQLPSAILDLLSRSQVDLALMLLQRLISLKNTSKLKDLVDQFPVIWQSVSGMIPHFDMIYTGPQAEINRKLLRIMFLGIQPLTRWKGREPDLAASVRTTVVNRLASTTYTQLLEIVTEVIAKGFKSLAGLIHENPSAASPSDFALLTAMFQTILAIPGIETIHSPMVLQFQNAEVNKYATSLFSWSDKLLVNGDPVYGEHSILFLLELSSIPSMAEILAVDGVLSQLSFANLMTLYSRRGGSGPFDNPPRAHSIWARGVLPLCLNLLSSVGGPISAEVVSFLQQSSAQIARAARELDNTNSPFGTRPTDTHMTLTTAVEIHTLSLLSAAIETVRMSGGAADVPSSLSSDTWDLKAIKEDLEEWLSLTTVRRDWIVPVGDRDAEMANMKPLDPNSKCESRLEERVWAELRGAKECLNSDQDHLE